jgi:hypothetical protein
MLLSVLNTAFQLTLAISFSICASVCNCGVLNLLRYEPRFLEDPWLRIKFLFNSSVLSEVRVVAYRAVERGFSSRLHQQDIP